MPSCTRPARDSLSTMPAGGSRPAQALPGGTGDPRRGPPGRRAEPVSESAESDSESESDSVRAMS